MKLSSILLLGANLIAVPCAAAADDSSGNWLKASLAEIKQTTSTTQVAPAKRTPIITNTSARRATTQGAKSATIANKPVMLRVFQSGRSLPRQKDLVSQYAQLDNSMSTGLMPQQASLDPQSQLNGRICAFQQPTADAAPSPYQQWAGVAARAAKNEAIARPVKAAVQKVMAKAPALAAMPINGAPLQEPQFQQQQQMVAMMPPVSQPMMPMQMQQRAPQQQNQGPIFSAEDEAAFNRILSGGATRGAGTSTGDMTTPSGNPASGAGQAPFPLNLLFGTTGSGPTQKPNNPLVGKPKFGQWHQKSQLSSGGFGGSYITHGTKRRKNVASPAKATAQPSTKRQIVTGAKKRFAPPANMAQSQPVRMPATVAQYPPYQGNYNRPF